MVSHHPRNSQPAGSAGGQILIVEDDPEIARALAEQAVKYFDRPAVIAASLFEADSYLDENRPAIVLLDMLLPDGDGSELLLRLHKEQVGAVAVITAAPSLYRATAALRTRAADFLVKPFTTRELEGTFERLARRLSDDGEVARLREQLRRSEKAQQSLRLKIDILCKDLVGGYQKLLAKMGRPHGN
jgi:DNA-binding response OmpR family regulator